MVFIPKDNTGSLFNNTRKTKDTHPDRTGSLRIDGKDYWLSAWKKSDKNGVPWLSLALKPKDGAAEPKSGPKAGSPPRKMSEDNDSPWERWPEPTRDTEPF